MNKYNVCICAIVTIGVVLVAAIGASCIVLDSNQHGLFDYLMQLHK